MSSAAPAAAMSLRRDRRVISLISLGHGFSHFYQLALPPLFPLMHADKDWSFAQLGLITTLMYVVSACLQPPSGFLVDRFGARRVLLTGLFLMSAGTLMYGLAPAYWVALACAVLVGIGNSVFHPCDYSVMNATISEERIGKAYSYHIFGGYIGYAIAPVLMAGAGALIGWQTAIIAAGIAGFIAFFVIMAGSGDFRDSSHEAQEAATTEPSATPEKGVLDTLLQAPILFCWLFFLLVAMAQIGLQSQSVSILSLESTFAMDKDVAGVIVSLLLAGTMVGVLIGGKIADQTNRHDIVVGVGYAIAAVLMSLMYFLQPGIWGAGAIFLVSGLLFGLSYPSRDMVVRSSTPKGASGKVFGFVYSGMDFGSFMTPVMFGFFIDEGIPTVAFLFVAILWFLSIFVLKATSVTARRRDLATA